MTPEKQHELANSVRAIVAAAADQARAGNDATYMLWMAKQVLKPVRRPRVGR